MTLAIYESALNWISKGFDLLPIQPGTKKLLFGFGMYQKRIVLPGDARQWFFKDPTRYNLAVAARDEKFILDFDDWDLYLTWIRTVKKFDDRITTSWTEITPNNGAHVFLSGQIPQGIQLVPGVEIKRVVLVAPSEVQGIDYQVIHSAHIYAGPLDACFFPLSKSPSMEPARPAAMRSADPRNTDSKISAIKSRYPMIDTVKKYFPQIIFHGRGRFITACCPFHKEKEPSFWIDTERNIFGCHACKIKGDVINFFALASGIKNIDAVDQLARSL